MWAIRRRRLRDSALEAVFHELPSAPTTPAPIEVTEVQVPQDKKIGATVTIENTGSQSVTGDFYTTIFYAKELSDSSGNPEKDAQTWFEEKEAHDVDAELLMTLNPGDTHTFDAFCGVPASSNDWAEGDKIDAGVCLIMIQDTTRTVLDSLKITDAVEIVAPALRVEITGVTFSEA